MAKKQKVIITTGQEAAIEDWRRNVLGCPDHQLLAHLAITPSETEPEHLTTCVFCQQDILELRELWAAVRHELTPRQTYSVGGTGDGNVSAIKSNSMTDFSSRKEHDLQKIK